MISFATGLSALRAARLGIQTVGHNLANATTPGYSRERVLFESAQGVTIDGFRIGGGINATSVERVTDELLASRVRLQAHEVGRRSVSLSILQEVEYAFAEPGSSGISEHMALFFNSLSSLATTPEAPQRDSVIQSAAALVERLRQVRSDIGSIGGNVKRSIRQAVGDVNRLADGLALINRQIAITGGGQPPNDLLDRQAQMLEQLSQIVDVDVRSAGGGRVNVTVGGQIIVSENQSHPMNVLTGADGFTELRAQGGAYALEPRTGTLRGLLDMERAGTDGRIQELDRLAKSLVREFNRRHATGVPVGGGLTSTVGGNVIADLDGDGDRLDTIIADAGLPFTPKNGQILVNVRNRNTGEIKQARISVDPQNETVGALVAKLNAVGGLAASVDAGGHFVVSAQAGHDFHFAAVVNPKPDAGGTFGAKNAQLISQVAQPFSMSVPAALTVRVDGGPPQNISFIPSAFQNPASATTDELVQVFNSQLTGAMARNEGGRLVISSLQGSSASSLQVTDGTGGPAAAMGLSTALRSGSDLAVDVTLGGEYTGGGNDRFTFRAAGTGTIGVTPGLGVQVLNSAGAIVATLDVGDGYAPGEEIDVGFGLKVAFSPGDIAAGNDRFDALVTADSDTADILIGFGLNSFFNGADAATIRVSPELLNDPARFALGKSGVTGDTRNVQRMLALRDGAVGDLSDLSLSDFYNGVVADVGRETSRAMLALDTQEQLYVSLAERLEQVRGVSIDEELAELQRFEQAFQAASRYISTINEITQTLLSI